METDLRAKIKTVAVDHFNRDGYHGTTIRHIAQEAGCSLPMVYYYFTSKRELFHEIIRTDYFTLLKTLAEQVRQSDIVEYYTEFVFNTTRLSDFDRKIYRLGVKVYLSFDGDEELLGIMDAWERSILPRHYERILPHLTGVEDGVVIVRTLIHVLENLIESVVVKGRILSKEEIREEIRFVLKTAT